MTDQLTDTASPDVVLAELRGASKTFGTGAAAVRALVDVDLTVRAGELLAVLGPNGAGKTTALSMLTGLSRPTSGMARLFGRDPRDLAARQRIGVMLQSSGVPDTLRVRELLTAFRGYYPAPLPVASVVTAAGLQGLENRLFGTLSGGQQRRVLFAIALCGDPGLVFVDEPTTGLDAEARRTLWATLRELAGSGRGVVLTTHYLEEADALADRIVVLNQGRVIAEGSPSQVKSLVPGRRISAESTVTAAEASRWAAVHHAVHDGSRLELLVSEAEPVVRQLLARDQSVTGLTVTEPTLEDAFLTLTNRMEVAA
ncbi:ABC transporter ATP-binding protein [Intrasporangium sp.]|jgi:ABC-2 type transport system ATP-binding protein|uniref:ABC transporter ATP-binding protein n=1 Tax=Intrasporangium sp. TaxID=1925024 RepID=UPI0033655959